MDNRLEEIKKSFLKDLASGVTPEFLRLKYLGRKSELSNALRQLRDLDLAERKKFGDESNKLKDEIQSAITERSAENPSKNEGEKIDVTLPGAISDSAVLHPITKVEREIRAIFYKMGFTAAEGPEVETDYYNFEALNMPKGHPARDMQDTFYADLPENSAHGRKDTYVLRTHISPMQIRVMEKHQPPLAMISSGRVFRHEATNSRHDHTWDYMEGFAVGNDISLANLKYTLASMLKEYFGGKVKIRLRPSYFPFVEPGLEVDVSCVFCAGTGCKVCGSGWLEILGAGMIHPNLFKAAGYPKGKYTGFAFGLGLSRFAMLKYNISDIRLLYKNDLRYVK